MFANEKLTIELTALNQEHRELDAIAQQEIYDQLSMQRIKKRKLWIKDRMNFIRSMLHPDILA